MQETKACLICQRVARKDGYHENQKQQKRFTSEPSSDRCRGIGRGHSITMASRYGLDSLDQVAWVLLAGHLNLQQPLHSLDGEVRAALLVYKV